MVTCALDTHWLHGRAPMGRPVWTSGFPGGAGEMQDAAEVLDTLYESLVVVAGPEAPINAVFSLNIVESVTCRACGTVTHMQDNSPVALPRTLICATTP